ncbi:NUDIX domain-containing protein [Nonomuraea phyllanthi]|uniref:NUDIX domain-containing protein n=1 Tax=Nonomuraea phyllanthi TaxID=2219224 RepID=A0A5C4V5U1_9ACTN|nr:NUDIX hydrolase [Nonomuraea phyllanthi]KAB8186921.1 NUDIX domain-containing protein [Nonomuraea phyllanthi]
MSATTAADARVQFAQKAVILDGDRVLTVRKGPDDPFQPGRWELPGGRMRAGESPDDALAREVWEEVGLKVIPGRPLAVWSWRLGDGPDAPTVVAVARLCATAAGSTPRVVAAEIDRAAWVPVGDVLTLDLIPSARGPITEALAQLDTGEKTHG